MDPETDDLTAGAPPQLLSFVVPAGAVQEWAALEMAARHSSYTGSHSHVHPAYGSQGSDATHEHMHTHDGDSNHGHHEEAAAATTASGWEAAAPDLAALLASAHETVPDGGSLVAAAMEALGSPWGIEQRGESWAVLGRDGDVATFGADNAEGRDPRAMAVEELGRLAFADQGSRPVLADTWRSEMCYEGETTPDGRLMKPGALAYRDTPMPLMLQTTTDVGHFGAVLCGAINQAATVQQVALGSGEYDDTEAGRQALQIVQARGRFGVSIDGMAPVEYEVECVEYDEDGWCNAIQVTFSLLTVGGLTMTPFPAFPNAYIAAEQRAQAAAGEHHGAEGEPRGEADVPCEDCEPAPAPQAEGQRRSAAGHVAAGHEEPTAAGRAETIPFSAAAVPLVRGGDDPPAEWFAPMGDGAELVAAGDGRLVEQDDRGHLAVPFTIEPNGRVYGHVASWFTCHTGYADRCVTAPRSRSEYAAFNLRPVPLAGGGLAHVGHISMGCGHADTSRPLSVEEVRAHYDGGPGALSVALVRAGQDSRGPWICGSVDPDRTTAELARAASLNLSGDWREVWRGRGLDLVAVLGGVLVPGFPLRSALAAAGLQVVAADDEAALPRFPQARFNEAGAVALVAAGVVRRPLPWESAHAEIRHEMDELRERMDRAERVTNNLRPLAASAMLEQLEGASTNGGR